MKNTKIATLLLIALALLLVGGALIYVFLFSPDTKGQKSASTQSASNTPSSPKSTTGSPAQDSTTTAPSPQPIQFNPTLKVDDLQAIASEEAPSGLRKQAHSSGTISLAYPIGWKADQETGGISDDVNVITLTVESGKGNPACILVDNPDEPYSSRIADFEASDQVVEKDEFTFNGKAAMRFKRIQKTATGANINTYIDYFFDGDGRQSYQFTCLLVPEIDEATVDTLVHYLQLK